MRRKAVWAALAGLAATIVAAVLPFVSWRGIGVVLGSATAARRSESRLVLIGEVVAGCETAVADDALSTVAALVRLPIADSSHVSRPPPIPGATPGLVEEIPIELRGFITAAGEGFHKLFAWLEYPLFAQQARCPECGAETAVGGTQPLGLGPGLGL